MLAVLLSISMIRLSVSSWGLCCKGGGRPGGATAAVPGAPETHRITQACNLWINYPGTCRDGERLLTYTGPSW